MPCIDLSNLFGTSISMLCAFIFCIHKLILPGSDPLSVLVVEKRDQNILINRNNIQEEKAASWKWQSTKSNIAHTP